MSYKTDRLVRLFPDAYATQDRQSLLYKLLDALGSELFNADQALKNLLKSHWVNYASGRALDGLAAIYGVTRRTLPNGELETDEGFRLRLKSIVELFRGGGTVPAIKGAVRSALGLPFSLDPRNLPADLPPELIRDLENLIVVEEFSPQIERLIGDRSQEVTETIDGVTQFFSQIVVSVNRDSAQAVLPQIAVRFSRGAGRRLRVRRLDNEEGIQAREDLLIPPEATLTLSSGGDTGDNRLIGRLGRTLRDGSNVTEDVSSAFSNLDGTTPARLPEIPPAEEAGQTSNWEFRATGGQFDIGSFDNDTFDLPEFEVEMRRVRFQLLTFEVQVPYLIQDAVNAIARRYGYRGNLFVFQGLRPEQIPEVVRQTQAAGVDGKVKYSLNFLDIHNQSERFTLASTHRLREDAAATDNLNLGSFKRPIESHNLADRLSLGGVFDIATFDTNFSFS
jgi:hypothetical protein